MRRQACRGGQRRARALTGLICVTLIFIFFFENVSSSVDRQGTELTMKYFQTGQRSSAALRPLGAGAYQLGFSTKH